MCFDSRKKGKIALNFSLDLFSWTSLHWVSYWEKKKNLLLGSIALSESVWLWAVLTQSHSLSVNWEWFSLLLGSALPPKSPQTPRIGHTQLDMGYLFLLQLHLSCCSLVSGWFSQGTFSAIHHTQSTDFDFITNKESQDKPFNTVLYQARNLFLISVRGILCPPHLCSALKSKYHCLGEICFLFSFLIVSFLLLYWR